ncbi:hypothetical protein H2248_008168 [Termitomyces sp. 'cryptogamus']|nr:hypothetical protein H2248_008168 [Termitomyces sp. 'cryptogamus']
MYKRQAQSSSQLCAHCNQKPKHVGHPYCSRTCAKEASSVASSKTCIQCHQRPKFQGFDFCSKTCAHAAQAANLPPPGRSHQQKQQTNATRTAAPQNSPFIQSQTSLPAAFPTVTATTPAAPVSRNRSPPIQTSAPPFVQTNKCRIDECWQPVETDMQGFKISNYCSQEHAEDAVLSGLAKACVMCLRLPQSDIDYFCSQACKDKSLHK